MTEGLRAPGEGVFGPFAVSGTAKSPRTKTKGRSMSDFKQFARSGHPPTLLCAFLHFDISFMVW